MPTDIMKETDRIKLSNTINDAFNQKLIEIKSIWQENNNINIISNSNNHNTIISDYDKKSFDGTTYTDFINEAQSDGFIVGLELENVKAKSRRSLMQQMSNHISINFQSLYGKENNGVRQNYFQIGVRVPTKEHVSEIVGKQGLKIKEIREKTGALIITPGESEDHVFIIEALPNIALSVGRLIKERAHEITLNRQRENNQKVSLLTISNRFGTVKPFNAVSSLRPILATGIIEVPKNIVGRIIGTHGSIITTIQKDTGTEIRSPPKDNNPSNNNSKAKFEILVYQRNNSIDVQEAIQRIKNAKQLIAHVAMHQMERIRAEESPFSNYRIKNMTSWEKNLPVSSENSTFTDKEKLLNYQMQSISWLWNDIDRLEDQVADEVVLRILEESKKKSKIHLDYKLFDAASISIDRYDDIGVQPHSLSPFKQMNSYVNGYDISSFSSSIYSETSPMLKSTSTNSLNNNRIIENSTNQFSTSSNFTSRCVNATDNLAFSIIKSTGDLNLENPIVNAVTSKSPTSNSINIKSYADNFKAFNTSPSSIVVGQPSNTSVINSTSPFFFSNAFSNSHGAIGDHIRKLNLNKTAQFQ